MNFSAIGVSEMEKIGVMIVSENEHLLLDAVQFLKEEFQQPEYPEDDNYDKGWNDGRKTLAAEILEKLGLYDMVPKNCVSGWNPPERRDEG